MPSTGRMGAMTDDCNLQPEGEETYTFRLPRGFVFRSELQPNQSTSISVIGPNGNRVVFWNSGTFMTCALLGAGTALMVTSFSRNIRLGELAFRATALGCSYLVNRTTEDGDTYVPPC